MSIIAPGEPASAAWRAELTSCLALAWPLVLTNAIEMAINVTNIAFIGRLGADALAASTLALGLYNLFLLFGIGVTAAVAALIAPALGAGQGGAADARPAVRRIVQQAVWGVAVMIVPIWLVLWHADSILVALGQEPALAAAATAYLHVLQWSLFPILIYLVLRSTLAALDSPRWAVLTGIGAVAVNAGLNTVLTPGLGLIGSAIATLVTNVALAGALCGVVMVDPRLRDWRLAGDLLRPRWAGSGAFWRLGLPIGISLLFETGMFSAASALIGPFGTAALAAHAIALQVASVAFMLPLGIAQSATIRIGRAWGRGDRLGVVRAGWTALSVQSVAMLASASVLVIAPRPIAGWFLNAHDPERAAVKALAVTLLGLAGLFQIADGAQVVLGGMLRGLQDTRVPMLITAVGYWGLGVPLSAGLAFGLHWQAPGVWLGLCAGLFAVALLLLLRWRALLARHRRSETVD